MHTKKDPRLFSYLTSVFTNRSFSLFSLFFFFLFFSLLFSFISFSLSLLHLSFPPPSPPFSLPIPLSCISHPIPYSHSHTRSVQTNTQPRTTCRNQRSAMPITSTTRHHPLLPITTWPTSQLAVIWKRSWSPSRTCRTWTRAA